MRIRSRVALAGALVLALSFPAVALGAEGFLNNVTFTLPPGWTVKRLYSKSTGYGRLELENKSADTYNNHINGTVTVYYEEALQYKTFEEFRAGTNPDYAPPPTPTPPAPGMPAVPEIPSVSTVKAESSQTTFKGKSWYYTTIMGVTTIPELSITVPEHESRVRTVYYYMNLGGHGVMVIGAADASDVVGGAYLKQFADMEAQMLAVVDSLQFNFGTNEPTSGGGWRTVVGGIAAIAAAAVAMAGAFLSTPEGRRRAKEDPTMVVGHILQLSTRSISVAQNQQAPLEVSAWLVRANGAYEPAPDAIITLSPPAGVSAAPQSGSGTLRAGLWQTGALGRPAILQITAASGGSSTTQQLPVRSADALALEVTFEPAAKTSLFADDKDSVTLIARIQPEGGVWAPDADPAAARASIGFRILGGWLYGSEPADWGADARAMRFMARQADPLHPVAPPESVDVEVTATVGAEQLRKVVAVGIARQPVLEATPDEVTLAAESRETARVALVVRDPGQPQWHYREQWAEGAQPLAECAFSEESQCSGTLTLTESAPASQGGTSPKLWAKLTIVASADGYADVPREINVGVLREGLFAETVSLHPDGTYHVRADGKKQPQTIVFRAYVRDPATGRIAATPQFVNALKFEAVDEPGSPERNSAEFSQLAIDYRPEASAAEREPGGAYSFAFRREVPGDGEVRPVRYLVTAPGLDPDKYWCEIRLGLETTAPEAPSAAWQAEYTRADDILKRLMPASYYPQWKQTLDTRSKFLGAEGMAELRKRIWVNATELVIAQGAEGYVAEANWADAVVKKLEVLEVAGDVAMMYLCSIYLGPAAGQAAQTAKPIITSAIGEYLAGTTPDEWVNMQIASLGGLLESKTVDVAAWEKLAPNRRWTLWALFVGYHFLKTTLYEGKSVMDGFKRSAEQAGGVAIMGWVQKMLHNYIGSTAYPSAPKPVVTPRKRVLDSNAPGAPLPKPGKPIRPTVPRGGAPRTREPDSPSAARIRAATRVGPDGVPLADRNTVLATMRDPAAVRALKTASPEVQAAFNNTRNQIYRQHDADVLRELRNQPGMKGKRLAVVDVRTPGSDPNSVNTDRDFRVVEIHTDPATGRTQAIEVDRRAWQDSSNRAFSRATGGPVDTPTKPNATRDWAKDHQQNATDQYHAEASPDLAREAYVHDPATGTYQKTQVKPNIEVVEAGQGTLHDPEALGKTYQTKVNEASHPAEKFVQAGKAVDTMTAVREGYAAQGYKVGELPPRLQEGMAIVNHGRTNFNSPASVAAADAALREAGFRGGLPTFMNQVSAQIEALKWAKKS